MGPVVHDQGDHFLLAVVPELRGDFEIVRIGIELDDAVFNIDFNHVNIQRSGIIGVRLLPVLRGDIVVLRGRGIRLKAAARKEGQFKDKKGEITFKSAKIEEWDGRAFCARRQE